MNLLLGIKTWFTTYLIYILIAMLVSMGVYNYILKTSNSFKEQEITQLKIDLVAAEYNAKVKKVEGKIEVRKETTDAEINATFNDDTIVTGTKWL